MAEFQLVRLEELEPSFSQPMTSKDMKQLSEGVGIPTRYLKHEVIFTMPDCALSREYQKWSDEAVKHVENPEQYVMSRLQSVDKFMQIHGVEGVQKFHRTMKTYGHPYQPVRLASDIRATVSNSLDSTATFVAE